jgi:hypothetical protein
MNKFILSQSYFKISKKKQGRLEKCQAGLGQRDPPPSWPEEEKKTGCS